MLFAAAMNSAIVGWGGVVVLHHKEQPMPYMGEVPPDPPKTFNEELLEVLERIATALEVIAKRQEDKNYPWPH
jgi:hypothetical protein